MGGLFASGRDLINRGLNAAAGVAITYTRGATTVVIPAGGGAWVGRVPQSAELRDGVRLEFGARDYLVLAAALSALGEPREEDRITEVINGVTCTFAVRSPGTGVPPWEWSDDGRTRYRLHTAKA